ncbi:MAG TPA: thioredoxin family protein [Trebonia sp.]|nr:thioredoxin family protein [Trebonia sp.]
MVGGLVALVVVLAVASAAGFAVRHRQGRFRAAPAAGRERPAGSAGLPQSAESVQVTTGSAASAGVLSAADLGAPLGAQATLVQFSTRVCAYCGPTRELLTEVARERGGVAFVEIDAAQRMDLTRRLHVLATPTVLVLDPLGGIASRASGPVRRADLADALGKVLTQDGLAS